MTIERNEQYGFMTIEPSKDKMLTDWDKKEILEYTSYTIMLTPLNYDIAQLYEITIEENEQYMKMLEDKIRELEEERNNGN